LHQVHSRPATENCPVLYIPVTSHTRFKEHGCSHTRFKEHGCSESSSQHSDMDLPT
jgi:hypothetical protein